MSEKKGFFRENWQLVLGCFGGVFLANFMWDSTGIEDHSQDWQSWHDNQEHMPTLAARVDAEDDSFYVSFDVTPTYVERQAIGAAGVDAPKVQVWLDSTDYRLLMIAIEGERRNQSGGLWTSLPDWNWPDQPDSIHKDSLGPPKCFVQIPCPDNKPGCLVFHSRPCTPDPNKVPEEK